MKLAVSQVEIVDDTIFSLVAKVTLEDVGVVSVTLHQKLFSAESWRELADAVARAITMMDN